MALICDTGVLYAAIDRRDTAHERCASLLTETAERIAVPAPVLVELDWLVASKLGPGRFDVFLEDIALGEIDIVDLKRPDYVRIRELSHAYQDLPLGFVDAAVVALAERLGEPKLASLDRRHLGVVRPRHASTFELLPAR